MTRSLSRFALGVALCLVACESTPPATAPNTAPGKGQPSTPAPPKKAAKAEFSTSPSTLTVLGLNDLHGRLRALPVFAGYLERVRTLRSADGGDVLLLDAGDMFQGTLESNLGEGAPVVAAYNALGVTAATIGNHEFDFGPVGPEDAVNGDPQGALKARLAEAKFPIVSANLVEKSTGKTPTWPRLFPSVLLERKAAHVGIIGALTYETPKIVMSSYFQNLDVSPLAPAISVEAERLRKAGAGVVIVVAHAGAQCQNWDDPDNLTACDNGEILEVARALKPGLVDVIVAGHTHDVVAHRVNGIAIVESRANGRAFSRADLTLVAGKVKGTRIFPPEPLCPDPAADCKPHIYENVLVETDQRMLGVVAPALARAETERARALGVLLAHAAKGDHDAESPLGNLFADLMLHGTQGAEVAITNAGSLRADLPAGELTYGPLFEAMPFDNRIATLELTGAELTQVVTQHFASSSHGIISIAGVSVRARCSPGLVVELFRASGKKIKPDERLKLVTSDYLATGGDGLFGSLALPPERVTLTGALVRDVLVGELGKLKKLDPERGPTFDPKKPRLKLPKLRPIECARSR